MRRILILFIIAVICSIPMNLNAGSNDNTSKGDISIDITPILKISNADSGNHKMIPLDYPVEISYNKSSFVKKGKIIIEFNVHLKSNGLYAKHFGEKNAIVMGEISFPEDISIKTLSADSSIILSKEKTRPNVRYFFLEQEAESNTKILVEAKIPKKYIGEYVQFNFRAFYCEGILKKYREAISLTVAAMTGVGVGAKTITIPAKLLAKCFLAQSRAIAAKTIAKALTPALGAAGVAGLGTDFFTRVVKESNSRMIEQAEKEVSTGAKEEYLSKTFSLSITK